MNVSGEVVACLARKYLFHAEALVIIHDDLELPLGRVSVKHSGSAAGHNGVRSLHASFGTQAMKRLRLGVGRPPEGGSADRYVLEPFLDSEKEVLGEMIDEGMVLLDTLVKT
jgi:PTH1 family peptidyl-tRNA hydrolase